VVYAALLLTACGAAQEPASAGGASGGDAGTCGTACGTTTTGLIASRGSGFILLRWSPPENSAVPVTGFVVTVASAGANPLTIHTTRTSALIDNLVNDVPYALTVASDSSAGSGAPSRQISVTPTASCSRTFTFYEDIPVGNFPFGLFVADLTGSGHNDIAVANQAVLGNASVSVLLNDGHADFAQTQYPVSGSSEGLFVADVDHDGLPDLIAGAEPATVLFNEGGGRFGRRLDSGIGGGAIVAGDLDGDGFPDLVVAHWQDVESGALCQMNLHGSGFSRPTVFGGGTRPSAVALADLDGDGKLDLIVGYQDWLGVLLGNGDGTFSAQTKVGLPALPGITLAIADFDGDGKPDIAVGNGDGIGKQVTVLFNEGSPLRFRAETFPSGTGPFHVAAGDVDGDGLPDLAYTDENRSFGVLMNRGRGTFAPPLVFPTAAPPSNITLADVNGDGYPDAVITSTRQSLVSIYLNACAE
jgi:hypothetical protein